MAYKIIRPDGTTLLTLADNVVDQSATSLTLVGKNWSGYGEYLNNNFVRLLSNSASVTSKPPRSPITGQIWYDTGAKRLKIYDNGFKAVSGVPFASAVPATIQVGDLWYDTVNGQVKLYNGANSIVVGPSISSTAGDSGWMLPLETEPVTDITTGTSHDVLVLKSYDENVAIANGGSPFVASLSTKATYLPNAYPKAEVVTGITVVDDLRVYGQMTNHGMAASFNVETISPYPNNNLTNPIQIDHQNNALVDILNMMYPPNAKSTGTYQYPGMPDGSLSRVTVFNNDGSIIQTRLFRTLVVGSTSTWQAWNLFTLKNIID